MDAKYKNADALKTENRKFWAGNKTSFEIRYVFVCLFFSLAQNEENWPFQPLNNAICFHLEALQG